MALDPYALATVANFRAQTGIAAATLPDARVEYFIEAASALIETWCRRQFAARDYREFLDGPGGQWLVLRSPLLRVDRVVVERTAGLSVAYALANSSQATLSVSDDGTELRLESVVSGASATTTLDLDAAANDPLTDLATVITAVAGWTATAITAQAQVPSSDLWPVSGLNCLNVTSHLEVMQGVVTDYRVEFGEGMLYGSWGRSPKSTCVFYRAGYDAIPDDLAYACIEVGKRAYQESERDSTLTGERLGPYSWNRFTGLGSPLADDIQRILVGYKDYALLTGV